MSFFQRFCNPVLVSHLDHVGPYFTDNQKIEEKQNALLKLSQNKLPLGLLILSFYYDKLQIYKILK